MRYISIFSGIEAASCAFEPLGMEPVAFAEIDAHAGAVLTAHYPNVPNLGDVSKVSWRNYCGEADLVAGGSPCQSFSVAGKREGVKGESGLMYEFVRCVHEVRPRWFLWENVPGAFSSERGAAFGQLLHEMADIGGYGCAWRVLDAEFVGVAQRRRRVFLVGCAGNGFREACQVLFESECVPGNPAQNKGKRQELASRIGRGDGAKVLCMATGQANAEILEDYCPTLNAAHEQPIVVYKGSGDAGSKYIVRRITPTECERLQGFPDGWTDVPDFDGKPMSDVQRYKQLGNSMAVPVMRWIGERILMVDKESKR